MSDLPKKVGDWNAVSLLYVRGKAEILFCSSSVKRGAMTFDEENTSEIRIKRSMGIYNFPTIRVSFFLEPLVDLCRNDRDPRSQEVWSLT